MAHPDHPENSEHKKNKRTKNKQTKTKQQQQQQQQQQQHRLGRCLLKKSDEPLRSKKPAKHTTIHRGSAAPLRNLGRGAFLPSVPWVPPGAVHPPVPGRDTGSRKERGSGRLEMGVHHRFSELLPRKMKNCRVYCYLSGGGGHLFLSLQTVFVFVKESI